MSRLAVASLIDFHTHYRPRGWSHEGPPRHGLGGPPAEAFEDLDALAEESAQAGVDLRALSAPLEGLFGTDVVPATALVNGVNEKLAESVQRHDRFLGLATVDGYAGERGAEQARYAIEELGLDGIVLDSSRYGRYLSSPEALPTLEAAAHLAVPVFVHPVAAPRAALLVEAAGRSGNAIGRGLQNGVAFLAALHADLPTRLPDLHLVFTSLGSAAVHFAAEQIVELRARGRSPHLYVDTTRFDAPLVRYLTDVLGPERVVVGSDWPIRRDASRRRVDATLTAAGLGPVDQELVRVGNARRLFGLRAGVLATASSSARSPQRTELP